MKSNHNDTFDKPCTCALCDMIREQKHTIEWYEFVNGGLCSLCGNWGYLDTRGIKSPAGIICGKLNYCICPNGRSMKEKQWNLKEMSDGKDSRY